MHQNCGFTGNKGQKRRRGNPAGESRAWTEEILCTGGGRAQPENQTVCLLCNRRNLWSQQQRRGFVFPVLLAEAGCRNRARAPAPELLMQASVRAETSASGDFGQWKRGRRPVSV